MYAVGLYSLAAPSVWKETHNYHHRNNAKLLGSSIGSYPLITIGIWKGLNPKQRRLYSFVRHPLTILFAFFTSFLLGMCIVPFRRAPRDHWQGPLVMALYLGITAATGILLGWMNALLLILIPGMVSSALGSYLFYAQHNFPGAELRGRREWNYHHAALRCSSMFDMSPLMHWFTGNIGYHHVHHLNHQIPFYRLPEAMAGLPELQDPVRTSWHPRDVWACLRIKLWDPKSSRMVSWAEAMQIIAAEESRAAS